MVMRQHGQALREGCSWDGCCLSPCLHGCNRDAATGEEAPKLDPAVGPQILESQPSCASRYSASRTSKKQSAAPALGTFPLPGIGKEKQPSIGIRSLHLQPWFKGREVSSAPFSTGRTARAERIRAPRSPRITSAGCFYFSSCPACAAARHASPPSSAELPTRRIARTAGSRSVPPAHGETR